MISSVKAFLSGPIGISLLIVAMGCISFATAGISFLETMELKMIDLRFNMRGERAIGDTVVLAAIDEKSLQKEGRWVWPRSVMAELITRISEKGARVIALDIGFFEAEGADITRLINDIEKAAETFGRSGGAFTGYLEDLKYQTDNDRILVQAIENAKAKVVLGYFFHMDPADAAHITPSERARHAGNIDSGRYNIAYRSPGRSSGQTRQGPLLEAHAPQSNIPKIAAATPYSGYFNKLPDADGVIRRLPMIIQYENRVYSPLALKALGAYLGAPLSVRIDEEYGVAEIRIGDIAIPVNETGEMVINYRGGARTFPYISATDILRDRVPENRIKDKIVLVGATAIGIHDEQVTPMDMVFPGPEVHLNVMDSILSEDFLYQPSWAGLFDLLIIFFSGLGLAVVLTRTGPMSGSMVFALLFGGYLWLCHYFFSVQGWILNMVYPLSVFVLVYLAVTSYKYFFEEGQKKFIREAFSKYLAPEVVEQLIKSPQKLVLGGERREITAFFSDVEGFTGISEKMTPEVLVDLLNEFLTEVTDIILAHKGAVDKFEGDAVIAFFGAPNDLPNHAGAACLACADIQKRMVGLREKWRREGRPELKVRIGLFSGTAVVGNMGSRNRMDYTMMGDTVNTAARLEGVNKLYGTYTLIGETTCRAAGSAIEVREIDNVKVVGKDEPIAIYEVLGRSGEVDAATMQAVDWYARGMAAYRQRQWEQAIGHFENALDAMPGDRPSQTMIERCLKYIAAPPAADWDGSYRLDQK